MKAILLRLFTVLIALGVSFLMLEVGLRLFAPVTDRPLTSYDPDVGVHLTPGQDGVVTMGPLGAFKGRYHINNAGWNSIHDYAQEKPDGGLRVAVIGDSFIEGLAIDVEAGVPAVMERELQGDPRCGAFDPIEVYPFGYSGIPMSQYVSIMRHVRERYDPDVYVIHIFPINDFEPSLSLGENGASHVLTYRPDGANGFAEVAHVPFEPSPLRRFAGQFATVRYLMFNVDIVRLPFINQLFTPANFYGEAAEVSSETLGQFTDFAFAQYKSIAGDKPLLITTDGDRKGIYETHGGTELIGLDGVDPQYFEHVQTASLQNEVDYLPLHPVLEAAYLENSEPFEFVSDGQLLDGHWNARTHGLIGDALADWVAANGCGLQAVGDRR